MIIIKENIANNQIKETKGNIFILKIQPSFKLPIPG